ncbi:MAG: hypothetical protein OXN88_04320 [Chloroflexota bacterium]|nr:hypothetical protein [Chloroflexota bacterium]
MAGIDFGAPDYSDGDSVVFGFYVATADDDVVEADGAVTATITTGDGYTIGTPASASVTVHDDDLPTVTIAAAAAAVTEGSPAVFTVTPTRPPPRTPPYT